jgi:hypothetical protein
MKMYDYYNANTLDIIDNCYIKNIDINSIVREELKKLLEDPKFLQDLLIKIRVQKINKLKK